MDYHIPRPPIQQEADRKKYHEYLDSTEWKAKRDIVFDREKGVCQGCRAEPIEQVHHMTYTHLYDELLFQLVGLCADCHNKTHYVQKR